jgi:hypothetical protein
MRSLLVSLALVASVACAGRQVEVRTGPTPAADVSIRFTNNISQAVNVYVTTGGSDVFLKQVAANSVEVLPVSGMSAGSVVTLKARTVRRNANVHARQCCSRSELRVACSLAENV